MKSINELMNGRSDPGILIVNLKGRLTFTNDIAWSMFAKYRKGGSHQDGRFPSSIPPDITKIIEQLKERHVQFARNSCIDAVYLKSVIMVPGFAFTVRGFIIAGQDNKSSAHFLILLDKIATRRKINLSREKAYYGLSQRESSLVQLLIQGMTNKEIANTLSIAESTVKEYMRQVMTKVGADTRGGVVARILSVADPQFEDLDHPETHQLTGKTSKTHR